MLGISKDIFEHQFNVNPCYEPVKQKKINFAPKRQKEEVHKLQLHLATTDCLVRVDLIKDDVNDLCKSKFERCYNYVLEY